MSDIQVEYTINITPDGVFNVELVDKSRGNIIGYIIFFITGTSSHLQFLSVSEQYRGRNYSLYLMRILVDYLMANGVVTLTLDDMSDYASQTPPKKTRRGTIYDTTKLSLYTRLGCNAENSWDEPERTCLVRTLDENLKKLRF